MTQHDGAWYDRMYNNRALVPEHETHFARWRASGQSGSRVPAPMPGCCTCGRTKRHRAASCHFLPRCQLSCHKPERLAVKPDAFKA